MTEVSIIRKSVYIVEPNPKFTVNTLNQCHCFFKYVLRGQTKYITAGFECVLVCFGFTHRSFRVHSNN